MIILGMDTSSVNASVAVMNDKKLLGEYVISNDRTHSVIIMPLLDDLLKKCGISLSDIDIFSTAVGPGSFTGLRIGIATVNTLARACEKPVIGVDSLKSLSMNFPLADDCIICPIIDARRGNVYNALYSNGKLLAAPRVIEIDSLLPSLSGEKVIFCGDGVLGFDGKIRDLNEPGWKIAPQSCSMQRASSVCLAAYERAKQGDTDGYDGVLPLYLRASQAERELKEKRTQLK